MKFKNTLSLLFLSIIWLTESRRRSAGLGEICKKDTPDSKGTSCEADENSDDNYPCCGSIGDTEGKCLESCPTDKVDIFAPVIPVKKNRNGRFRRRY
jgi:hypothetical protein